MLDAQEHDDLGIGERGFQVVGDRHAHGGEVLRHERRGADERDGGAHFRERVDVGAGDAAEENIAEDDDLAAAHVAEVLLHGERVEQALRGVLVGTVAGVDDRDAEDVGKVVGGTGGGVPDDDHIDVERLDVFGGVAQGLSLGGRGAGGVE
ncbi:MAG: hypothetical protein BWX86_01884 [Verrucomicrobia bacterium ADurb.Bin122]|nr:MAG: hypothetical protein BWX86_01884 [Verrucomicrobia bacterium ADurb.Bin122]